MSQPNSKSIHVVRFASHLKVPFSRARTLVHGIISPCCSLSVDVCVIRMYCTPSAVTATPPMYITLVSVPTAISRASMPVAAPDACPQAEHGPRTCTRLGVLAHSFERAGAPSSFAASCAAVSPVTIAPAYTAEGGGHHAT